MSTHWEWRCDCGESHRPTFSNHQSQPMARLLTIAKQLGSLGEVAQQAGDDISTVTGDSYSVMGVLGFFAAHKDHSIKLVSEYGEVWSKCSKRIRCKCGTERYCIRDMNHQGDCEP